MFLEYQNLSRKNTWREASHGLLWVPKSSVVCLQAVIDSSPIVSFLFFFNLPSNFSAESRTEAEAEPEVSSEPDAELEARSEPDAEPEQRSKREAEPESEPEGKSEPVAEAEAEGKSEPETEAEAEAEGKSEPEGAGEPEGDSAKIPRASDGHKYQPKNDKIHPMDCTDIVIGMARGDKSRIYDAYTRDRLVSRLLFSLSFWSKVLFCSDVQMASLGRLKIE